jgi:hypothetical protein
VKISNQQMLAINPILPPVLANPVGIQNVGNVISE